MAGRSKDDFFVAIPSNQVIRSDGRSYISGASLVEVAIPSNQVIRSDFNTIFALMAIPQCRNPF